MMKDIRRKVCQIANRLVKRGYIRACAMATAWKLIRCRSVSTRVTGTSFDGRQNVLELLAKYHPELISVKLIREPQNPYDRNAVAVVAEVRGKVKAKLGYLSQAVAAVVAAMMDKGLQVTGKQLRITGGYGAYESYGARITVTM
ncbi:MAG: HIRAN domain-containing protein [Oscillospiraceae bacterium]|nr:HIRAN domain-containing protein [Oscillospiraceae bacterium]